jgi:hypothetical protein
MVPEDVMDAMAARLYPPSVEEGFDKITRILVLATDVEQMPKEFPG